MATGPKYPAGPHHRQLQPVNLQRLLTVLCCNPAVPPCPVGSRSEEHTSELQSLMRSSYAVFCLKKQSNIHHTTHKTVSDKDETHKQIAHQKTPHNSIKRKDTHLITNKRIY